MKFNLKFDFVMPSEALLSTARDGLKSGDQDIRTVSKALLDLTSEATTIQKEMLADGTVDVGPYFDFWFADSILAANRLLTSQDENIRYLAQCLIDQEKSVIQSRKSFLSEMKRLGIDRKRSG